MVNENTLVIYKNKPAIIKEKTGDKFIILLQDKTQVKVRDKDIYLLHPGPVKDFNFLVVNQQPKAPVSEVWELLSGEDTPTSLKDLAVLTFDEYSPSSAYEAFCFLLDGLYFTGTIDAITPRSEDEVAAETAKRGDKNREIYERSQFLERLKICIKNSSDNPLSTEDARFMQDVEALALGKSTKSRTMKELKLGETPEEAHTLLLKTGIWTNWNNPHPSRFGLSFSSASICPPAPPVEDRRDLCHLTAFAIDSPWSTDPDDAISLELIDDDKSILYVHIADPAASILPDSPAETEARDRGATLYLPEGAVRMLAEEALPLFALGLNEKSPALTFMMTLDKENRITGTEIFPSFVNVKRITFEDADKEMDCENAGISDTLRALYVLAKSNHKRRTDMGAISIELPETHIYIENNEVKIDKFTIYRSSLIVRECMIIACEGAGTWASGNGLAFPYINQEVEIQGKIPTGIAGSWAIRKCMRPRVFSTKPARHQGLGLDVYTQVTSPLRRYTDLLAHMQIRAFLRGEKLLKADEVAARLGYSEAGVSAAVQAERASNNHWTMVYLDDKKNSVWDAVALEKKGNRWVVIIPSLALETQVSLQKDVSPNENVQLTLKSVNIPKGEAVFIANN